MALIQLTVEGYTEWAEARLIELNSQDITDPKVSKEIKRLNKWLKKKSFH